VKDSHLQASRSDAAPAPDECCPPTFRCRAVMKGATRVETAKFV